MDIFVKINQQPEVAYQKLSQYGDLSGKKNTKYAVLGKDVMAHIWADMENCRLPSWISPAPRNWGTTERGKLSADNWRVICTIHLLTSLIWLWRNDTGRKQELLVNLMDLVTAVRLANTRICSSAVIENYNQTMSRYLQGVLDLFPHEALKPNHHAALHIGNVMERFGPGHSHGSAYYERHIALYHRINTNRQIGRHPILMLLSMLTICAPCLGQIEGSILRALVCHANLSALLADDENIRKTVSELAKTMDAVQREDIRGSTLANMLNPSLKDLSNLAKNGALDSEELAMLHTLLPNAVLHETDIVSCVDRISCHSVCYGIFQSSGYCDCAINFYAGTGTNSRMEKTGVITKIFQHPSIVIDWYLVVREHCSVRDIDFIDPYLKYGFAAGYLCEKEPTVLHIITLSQIISHVALTPIEENLVHVMLVDRVSLHIYNH